MSVRGWLEVYADTHADWSPTSAVATLPGGRKALYYEVYASSVTGSGGIPATYGVFCRVWRSDCWWLKIMQKHGNFTKCGVCTFLKAALASAAGGAETRDVIRNRLARHYSFQGAQRLMLNHVEKACRQSNGKTWYCTIDKMDQNKTIVPAVWAHLKDPPPKYF